MHLQKFLPLLLATSVSALPGRAHIVREDEAPTSTWEDPPASTTSETPIPTASEEPEDPNLSPEEKCGLPFNDGDAEVSKDTWVNSGAQKFLKEYLEENGVENWIDNLFKDTIAGGEQGGSTYDCTNFPAEGSCTSPGHEHCLDYDPPEMFFVHLSIANLHGSFVRIHEDMQDAMIINLASEIKTITDTFGPPPSEDSLIFSMLIGVFVAVSAFAGPFAAFAAPATAVVGGLNVAAAVAESDEELEPIDFEDDLEQSLGEFYKGYAGTLKDTIRGIFGGDFSGFEGYNEDPVEFIMGQFADGKMLDHTLVNPIMDEYIEASVDMLKQALVIQAMIKEKHIVWQDFTKSKTKCDEFDYTVWMDGMCTTIAQISKGHMAGGGHPVMIEKDIYEPFTGDYGFDYEEVLQNALACNGSYPDLTKLPPLGEVPTFPPCFCNFEVQVSDFYGLSYEDYYKR